MNDIKFIFILEKSIILFVIILGLFNLGLFIIFIIWNFFIFGIIFVFIGRVIFSK